jgi:hypothetical protein
LKEQPAPQGFVPINHLAAKPTAPKKEEEVGSFGD